MNEGLEQKVQWIGGLFSSADALSVSCYDAQGAILPQPVRRQNSWIARLKCVRAN